MERHKRLEGWASKGAMDQLGEEAMPSSGSHESGRVGRPSPAVEEERHATPRERARREGVRRRTADQMRGATDLGRSEDLEGGA
jgi:hypothetical protein